MILFSSAVPLRPVGPGRPLTKIHEALLGAGLDDYRAWSPDDCPDLQDPQKFGDAIGAAYDDNAAHRLGKPFLSEAHGFLGTGGSSWQQMRAHHNGTLWFSTHFDNAERILTEEYAATGMQVPYAIHPYVRWRAKREQEKSDFIVVPSQQCLETYPEAIRVKARVAEFGVDAQEFPCPDRDLDGTLRILYPATNPPRKGFRYVREAWLGMAPHGKMQGYGLIMTGGTRIDVPEALQWVTPGWVDEAAMKRIYAQAHVMLHPSLEEGQALALLEGAASGLPLVATRESGLDFQDGKQGLVIEARSPKAIQDALRYLKDNPGEAKRMGREARAFAETRPWRRFQDRVVEIVREEFA